MRSADVSPTSELWSTTHAALCAGRWSIARRLLDDLARRPDYVDHLCSLATYVSALERNDAMQPLESSFRTLLADRIDLVNARAERNRDERLQQGRRELGNAPSQPCNGPCNCARCRTGIDMGLVALVRDDYQGKAAKLSNRDLQRAAWCIVDDCTTVLEHDTRYPEVSSVALARLQHATGFSFR